MVNKANNLTLFLGFVQLHKTKGQFTNENCFKDAYLMATSVSFCWLKTHSFLLFLSCGFESIFCLVPVDIPTIESGFLSVVFLSSVFFALEGSLGCFVGGLETFSAVSPDLSAVVFSLSTATFSAVTVSATKES